MFFWRVFFPFAVGYFLSQLLRSVNAVISADLITDMSLDAWVVGALTSAYFLAFASAQLPVGIALDRWGPRRTESLLLLFTALGAGVFATATTSVGLTVGRALIGLGVSACLMASFHAFALWSPVHRRPFLNGAVMSVGAAGALTATAPVEWTLAYVRWRSLFGGLAVASLVAAALIYFLSKDPEEDDSRDESLQSTLDGVRRVFESRVFWSIAPLSIAHQGTYLAIQSLWAGPWLSDVAGLSRQDVARDLLILAAGMALGFFAIGFLASRISRTRRSVVPLWGLFSALFQLVQLAIVLSWVSMARPLWFGFGFFGAAGMLSYGILTKRFPLSLAGRVNTGLNVFVFVGAFAIQAGIGAIIRYYSQPGEPFAAHGFQVAFAATLACEFLALVWLATTSGWRNVTLQKTPNAH